MGRGMSSSTKVEAVRSSQLEVEATDDGWGRKRSFDESFDGPMKNRSCTDILCLALFVICLVLWVYVALVAFGNGNPDRLIYPSDSQGQICGRGELVDRPFLLFFDLTRCLSPSVLVSGCPTPQVCVAACPSDVGYPYLDSRTNPSNARSLEIKQTMKPFCVPNATLFDELTVEELISKDLCPPWWLPSLPVLKRCLPSFNEVNGRSIDQGNNVVVEAEANINGQNITVDNVKDAFDRLVNLLNLRSLGERVFSDLDQTWFPLLIGLALGSLLAFLWIVLMRYVAGPMVWLSLFLSTSLLLGCAVYCFFRYMETSEKESSSSSSSSEISIFEQVWTTELSAYTELSITWLVLLVLSAVALLVVAILICCLANRIRLAIELIEEGSIAVSSMSLTLIFPIAPFVAHLGFLAFFVAVAVYLASMGEQKFRIDVPSNSDCNLENLDDVECTADGQVPDDLQCPNATCSFYAYGNDANAFYMQVYNLFMLLWSLFALSALEEMVLAGAFASWYFSLDKSRVSSSSLASSVIRTLTYHMGTLFFGSLIIAVVRLVRILLDYVQNKLKEYDADANPLVKALLCCCQCCFFCLEKFLRFVNRNAFIMTAIYGYSFISAAQEAFTLLMRNAMRVVVLDQVADFLLLLGKLVVVGSVGLVSFWVFSGRTGLIEVDGLNYYFLPIFIIVLGTYMVADLFFDVYAMAVDTIFLCFLEDIERNDGSPLRPYYMSDDLKKVLGYHRDESNINTRANSPT